jgi:hypothetical protein
MSKDTMKHKKSSDAMGMKPAASDAMSK